ncbi:MAG: phosphoglucosamine mutase [Rikenellaceae bacterium]
MTLIKSISGIRGTIGGEIGDNLTPIDLVKFASAYAAWLKECKPNKKLTVVVGRDARISGEMVSSIVEGSLLSMGVDVINIGLASTPTTEMAVIGKGADGGLILTASHNPSQWNALKLLNEKGEFLNDIQGKRVLEIADKNLYQFVSVEEIGMVVERSCYDSEHIDAVLALKDVDVELVKSRKFKVVVDAVNSVGGVVIPALLERMGVEVVRLNCEPNGMFAHNPEPLAENLTEISKLVVEVGADLGVVVDPDVDRLALVNPDGSMFGEEYTLVAVADYILSKTSGNTVSNLSSSRALADVTASYGGEYSAAAVGEVNVVAKMNEVGAIIGGEGNGGVIFPELHSGRDALVGVALILTHLAEQKVSLLKLKERYPKYHISKNKIELTPNINVDEVLVAVKAKYSSEKINDIDGVKIDFPTEWVHLRKSNTEPIIRIYSESRDKVAADNLAKNIITDINLICKL